jgi:hypothetical protein
MHIELVRHVYIKLRLQSVHKRLVKAAQYGCSSVEPWSRLSVCPVAHIILRHQTIAKKERG